MRDSRAKRVANVKSAPLAALHVLQPLEAVPLMMACSIGLQATNLWALRKSIQWKESLILVLGGVLGVPIAVRLLHTTDTEMFREGFGLAVALYAATCCSGQA